MLRHVCVGLLLMALALPVTIVLVVYLATKKKPPQGPGPDY